MKRLPSSVAVRPEHSRRSGWRAPVWKPSFWMKSWRGKSPAAADSRTRRITQYPFLIDNERPEEADPRDLPGGAPRRRSEDGLEQSAGDLFAPGSEPHAAGARREGRARNGKDARAGNRARRPRLAPARRGTARSKPTFASSPPARAIRCANVGTEWTAADTMYALGYYVPSAQDHIDIQFLPNLEGYIWVFPRCGHLSVGICGKGEPAQALRARLERYMDAARASRTRTRPSTATCCRRSNTPAGRRIAWRAMAGWRWATPAGWWIRSPAKACITRCARAIWRARWCLNDCALAGRKGRGLSHPAAPRFRGGSGVRRDARQARLSGAIPVQRRARAHGGVHAPQPALPRS